MITKNQIDTHIIFQGNILKCDGRNEKEEFNHLIDAMETLNFKKEERWEIFKLLAAILHIGNLVYNSVVIGKKYI